RAATADRRMVLTELPDATDLGIRGDDRPDHRRPGAVASDRTAPVRAAAGRAGPGPALGAQPLVVHAGRGAGARGLRAAGAGVDFAALAASHAKDDTSDLCPQPRHDRSGR